MCSPFFYAQHHIDDAVAAKQKQITKLVATLETVNYELAALFPQPSNPLYQNAQAVCANKNDADAQCILNAFLSVRQALASIR